MQAIQRIEVLQKVSPGLRTTLTGSKNEVVGIIRRLCGTAISNRLAPPAMNTACVAITICGLNMIYFPVLKKLTSLGGELFTERLLEQQAILDMLQYSDTKHAWPTADIQQRLKATWKCHQLES